MALSTLPLRSRDDDGYKRLVDLSLRDEGDSWEPDNPRVKVSIGHRVGDGMRISDRDIRLVPLDVAQQTPGTVSGDAVFFANSATDADHIMRVTPAGAEALVQLRSIDSPQRFRYRIDLPAGGAMRQQPDGSIVIMRNGRRAGAISKPVAWDADQRPIPVNSGLRDGVLTLEVAHRGRDVRYPAMLDPNYVDLLQYRWYRGGGNSTTNKYWSYVTNRPSLMGGAFDTAAKQYANGLYSISAGAQVFQAGSYGYWRFTAPGTTSVLEAEWTQLSHLAQYAGGPPPCIDYGLIIGTTAWKTHGIECASFLPGYRMSCWDCNDMDGFDYDPAVNGAQFGTGVYAATIANFQDYLGESTVYLADPEDPTLTLTQTPSTAWTTNPSQTIAASASDPGLGVQAITFSHPGNTTTLYNSGCLEYGPCPANMAPTSHALANLSDGFTTITATARDASYYSAVDANRNPIPATHVSAPQTATVRLDRYEPVLTLNEARNAFVGPKNDYMLSVTATDGDPATPATQRSGVTSLTATLDGQPMTNGTASAACTRPEASCALTLNATLTGTQIADLDDTVSHAIEITAADAVGHSKTDSFTFRVDATPPEMLPHDALAAERGDEGGLALTGDSYELLADARDAVDLEAEDDEEILPPPPPPGSGAVSMELLIDGQLQQTTIPAECPSGPGCEKSLAFTWNTASVPSGPHTFEISTVDAVGNVAAQRWEVTIEHPTPQPPRANTLTRTIRGGGGMKAGTSVAALGDVNADGRADYLVGTPGATVAGRPAGAAYLVLGSSIATVTDRAVADSTVFRISGPSESSGASYCGTAVAAAGDVNGDEIGDYLIGCPGLDTSDKLLAGLPPTQGRVFVVFGSTTPQDVDLSAAVIGSRGFVVTGPQETAGLGITGVALRPSVFGERLTGAFPGGGDGPSVTQDVNGDGLNDFVIGDAKANSAYVVFGRAATSPVDVTNLGADGGYSIVGSAGLTGHSAAIVEDITHDGLADTVIGAPAGTSGIR